MKRKLLSYAKAFSLLSFIGTLFLSQPVSAQLSDNNIIIALNSIRASIDALVNTAATYIFQTPPNVGNELVSNTTQSTAVQTITPNVNTLNSQDILTGLTPDVKNPNQSLIKMATIQASDTILPTLTLGGLPVPFFSSKVQQNMQNALAQGNENMNFQSLFSPLAYTTQDTQNYALNFIRFISGYAVPMSNVNLASYPESQLSMKQKLDIQNSPAYQLYSVQRRQLIAQQSSALSNLYWIYSRRLPITTIKASDTGLGIDSPSLSQIENYNATWRTASPTWYSQMSTASSTNVQRETLFILAEIQRQLYQIHQDNERMIAMTAISQAGNLAGAKQLLGLTEKQVLDAINQQVQSNSQQGTTGNTTNVTTTPGQSPQSQDQAELLKRAKQEAQEAEKKAKASL